MLGALASKWNRNNTREHLQIFNCSVVQYASGASGENDTIVKHSTVVLIFKNALQLLNKASKTSHNMKVVGSTILEMALKINNLIQFCLLRKVLRMDLW